MPAPPTPLRGRLTVIATGVVKVFMFNPSSVADSKSPEYGWQSPVGASHPVPQWGAGGKRTISFDLHLDGDRGQLARGGNTLDISDEIRFYQSLLYAQQYDNGFAAVSPSKVLFTMGTLYQGVECVVEKADPKITQFTPRMEPIRATISLTLSETVKRSKTAADILNGLPMAIPQNSRLELTDIISVVDPVTGDLTQPPYMDLRQRVTKVDPTDSFVTVTDGKSWANIGQEKLLDARAWWVVADLSDVIDPFTELVAGQNMRAPSPERYLFDILPGGPSGD